MVGITSKAHWNEVDDKTGQYTGFDSAHTLKKQENYRQQISKRFGSFKMANEIDTNCL